MSYDIYIKIIKKLITILKENSQATDKLEEIKSDLEKSNKIQEHDTNYVFSLCAQHHDKLAKGDDDNRFTTNDLKAAYAFHISATIRALWPTDNTNPLEINIINVLNLESEEKLRIYLQLCNDSEIKEFIKDTSPSKHLDYDYLTNQNKDFIKKLAKITEFLPVEIRNLAIVLYSQYREMDGKLKNLLSQQVDLVYQMHKTTDKLRLNELFIRYSDNETLLSKLEIREGENYVTALRIFTAIALLSMTAIVAAPILYPLISASILLTLILPLAIAIPSLIASGGMMIHCVNKVQEIEKRIEPNPFNRFCFYEKMLETEPAITAPNATTETQPPV